MITNPKCTARIGKSRERCITPASKDSNEAMFPSAALLEGEKLGGFIQSNLKEHA